MDHLKMHTPNIVDENVKKIGKLFPNCLTERLREGGKPEACIDFDKLKQELSSVSVSDKDERYQFTWPDKRKALLTANAPVSTTLRPCKEESLNYDNTQNLYIEGDNLDVLKLLRETYLNKIKMIYIDPPYNTGNDFVYEDDFAEDIDAYMGRSGQYDETGNRLVLNTESNGRFHTDWLNMMYPRLKLARDLLSDDGVIFISIDDNEVDNLKKICNELYGEKNYISEITWYKGYGKNDSKLIRNLTEYILVYAKNASSLITLEERPFEIEKEGYEGAKIIQDKYNSLNHNEDNRRLFEKELKDYYLKNNLKGISSYSKVDNNFRIYRGISLEKPADPCYFYDIIHPITGKPCAKPKKGWVRSEKSMKELIQSEMVIFGKDETVLPQRKAYLDDMRFETPNNFILNSDQGGTDIKKIFGTEAFSFPKPVSILYRLISMYKINSSEIILDFFSGSATTAHAVMQLNAEDGGNRKFIMVQLPEACDEKSEAYKAGYKNICEIGKERIRHVGKKIKAENPMTTQNLDVGFRVLKLDSSNMEDVYYNPAENAHVR